MGLLIPSLSLFDEIACFLECNKTWLFFQGGVCAYVFSSCSSIFGYQEQYGLAIFGVVISIAFISRQIWDTKTTTCDKSVVKAINFPPPSYFFNVASKQKTLSSSSRCLLPLLSQRSIRHPLAPSIAVAHCFLLLLWPLPAVTHSFQP